MDATCGPVTHASVYDGIKWTAYREAVTGNNDSNSTPLNTALVDESDEDEFGRGELYLLVGGRLPIVASMVENCCMCCVSDTLIRNVIR